MLVLPFPSSTSFSCRILLFTKASWQTTRVEHSVRPVRRGGKVSLRRLHPPWSHYNKDNKKALGAGAERKVEQNRVKWGRVGRAKGVGGSCRVELVLGGEGSQAVYKQKSLHSQGIVPGTTKVELKPVHSLSQGIKFPSSHTFFLLCSLPEGIFFFLDLLPLC